MNLLNIKDTVLKYGWMALAITCASLLLVQTLRLGASEIETAKVTTTLANERADWQKERVEKATLLAAAVTRNRNTEYDLTEQATQLRKQTNVQVQTLSAQRDGLLQRVRNAEARLAAAHVPGADPTTVDRQAPAGGDGAELLGTYGEEDVREAERADLIRLHLASCYRQYDRAQEALIKAGTGTGTGITP